MTKEDKWLRKRCGMITASELSNITSASGKVIDTNISYIRSKRWERQHGFSHIVSSKAMEIGNEQEPMIMEWCRANLEFREIIYSKDLQEIPFWKATDCPLGASPDAFTPDYRTVLEFKTLVGNTSIEFYGDKYTPYEEKKAAVWKDHGDQILGQFISNSAIEEIWVVKYIYQDDDIMADIDSPLAPWRGLVFVFKRVDYEESISAMKERVRLFDAMIDSHKSPSDFKHGDWHLNNENKLCK